MAGRFATRGSNLYHAFRETIAPLPFENSMSTNPYQPPAILEEPFSPLASQRPAAATVFGVLNVLFGIMGLCGTLASILFMVIPLPPQMTQNNPALQLIEENAFYRLFIQVGVGLGFIASIVLIVAGVGLY